tara:strand:- start:2599 stop:2991 length:393 start_codon:yes stop_codon:yes gene_type:complete
MSLLQYNLDNVKELATVPEGEYEVRVVAAEMKTSAKTGGQYLNIRLELPSESDSKGITHILMLPADDDDDKRKNSRLRGLKTFYEAFSIDYANGVETEDLVGANGWALVVEEDGGEYGIQNRVRRFVQGK